MSAWSSYRLEDFIPFTADVYYRLLERMGEDFWPLHLLTLLLGGTVLLLALRGRARLACLLLALPWLFVGVAYFMQRYGELNWAGRDIGWAFVLQGTLLAAAGASGFGIDRPARAIAPAVMLGMLLGLLGLLGMPLIAPLVGFDWFQAETFAIHPAPTAIVTLGVVLVLFRGIFLWAAGIIPLAWISVSGLTLLVLDAPWTPVMFAALAAGVLGLAVKSVAAYRRPPRGGAA
ncbi:DUF6064 family protein [Microbulbifer sediminum]|uniref:DUF6064 family protein n=1 Tax=Microbulbifer sediminum TaxID=2904250 RepID=UPI001F44B728|nr:DUF6064 family protein [Microbulbifer sediminum]